MPHEVDTQATAFVLDVGSCTPDHVALNRLLTSNFDVDVEQAHTIDDALSRMRGKRYRLVLVNRIIDLDGSEGIALLRTAKLDSSLAATPIMMISNFPEARAASVEAGGEPGFGKQAIGDQETLRVLSGHLPPLPRS